MNTNLQGRLRNTSLACNRGLMPLYEAVVNSIHAIEELPEPFHIKDGLISINILRKPPKEIINKTSKKPPKDEREAIIGFKIEDNGVGFTKRNYRSFEEFDSDYKIGKGGRGVGRLLWLKAFKRAIINSVFLDEDGEYKIRSFVFASPNGIINETIAKSEHQKLSTNVHLDGFGDRYQSGSPKTLHAIANNLFAHCLWYFIRSEGAPKIVIWDDSDSVDLDDILKNQMMLSSETEKASVKGTNFNLTHLKLNSSPKSYEALYCAANRLVKQDNLKGKVSGLLGTLSDQNGEFSYKCIVTSSFLDETVRPERTDFEFGSNPMEMFGEASISFDEVQQVVYDKVAERLKESLDDKKRLSRERVEDFVSKRAPKYRPILSRIPADQLDVDPDISDKDLDIRLHGHFAEIEKEILREGHELMQPNVEEEFENYSARLQQYLSGVSDLKKSDLASYVTHRRTVIDFLKKAIDRQDDGRYVREDQIHKLIMPMRIDSNSTEILNSNLWLINERLAFHDYLASDKTINSMPITGSHETNEPDICCLQLLDNPLLFTDKSSPPFASLTIIEIKRPMRDDAASGEDKDPIEQALGYLKRIREGNVTTANGRTIGNAANIPGFCYILCDLTKTIQNRCEIHDLTMTCDGLGYFGYNKNRQAYIEVLSFDQLVNSATERNKAFFDRLGLPTI